MKGAVALPLMDDHGSFSIRITKTVRTSGKSPAAAVPANNVASATTLKRTVPIVAVAACAARQRDQRAMLPRADISRALSRENCGIMRKIALGEWGCKVERVFPKTNFRQSGRTVKKYVRNEAGDGSFKKLLWLVQLTTKVYRSPCHGRRCWLGLSAKLNPCCSRNSSLSSKKTVSTESCLTDTHPIGG